MSILTGNMIQECVESGTIKIDPFNPDQLNPNSYNLRLGDTIRVYKPGCYLDKYKPDTLETWSLLQRDHTQTASGWEILPGRVYLASTVEVVGSDYYVPCLIGRSSFARMGLTAELSAGYGDLGFFGQWTLEITAAQPAIIYPDMQVCQVYFHTVEGAIRKRYEGRYQGQMGPVGSRI